MLGLVAVTGAPAAGKSTLAPQLAEALNVRLISKDLIKEAIAGTLGVGDESWSRMLGRASIDALLALAADVDTAVLEMYWRPQTVERLKALDRPIVEVFCACPPSLLIARARQRETHRHPIHTIRQSQDHEWAYRDWAPIFGGPVVVVDTSGPTNSLAIASAIRREFAKVPHGAQGAGQ
ncbi:MAG: AAA family ATPase [Micromonosporaceae bacterium]